MQAPHHNAVSWASYWSNNHGIPDKILALARDRDERGEASNARKAQKSRLPAPRPVYKEDSSESELTEPPSDGDNNQSDLDDGPVELPTDDENKMGGRGEPFTDGGRILFASLRR